MGRRDVRRNRGRLIVAAAALTFWAGCEGLLSVPTILDMDPTEGVPGTEVILVGFGFGDPSADPEARLRFGEREYSWFDEGQNLLLEWSDDRIRFVVPVEAAEGVNEVQVLNSQGESNVVEFEVLLPVAQLITGYVGAVALEGREALTLFKMQRQRGSDGSLSFEILPWDESGTPVTTVAYGVAGYRSEVGDLVLDAAGQAYLSVSRRPVSGASEGEHGLLVWSGNYSERVSFYETEARGTRIADWHLDRTDGSGALGLVMPEAGAIAFFGFDPANEVLERHVRIGFGNLGLDAQPEVAAVVGNERFLAAGRFVSRGTPWLAEVTKSTGWTIPLAPLAPADAELVDLVPVDFAPGGTEGELYLGYNTPDSAVVVRWYRYVDWVTQDGAGGPSTDPVPVTREGIAHLYFPEARLRRLLLEEEKSAASQPDGSDQVVVDRRLWLALDGDDPAVVGIETIAFPQADSDFTTWAQWLDVAMGGGTDPVSGPGTGTAEPPLYTVVRRDRAGVRTVTMPVDMTILPVGIDGGPTVLLLLNGGAEPSVAAIFTVQTSTEGMTARSQPLPPGSRPRLIYGQRAR